MNCPGCQQPMDAVPLEGTYRGPMTVDVCSACRGFWFDAGEQFRLTSAATLVLLRRVEASRTTERRRMGPRPLCPRCHLALGITYDLMGEGRYHYFRCPDRHGVFMPFFEFLRSQKLVRGLTPEELDALKQKLVPIHCPSCGAPIDLQRQTRCESCGSSLAVIDPEHLEDALRQLDADAHAAAPAVGWPPAVPTDEIVSDWRAEEEARRRREAGLDIDPGDTAPHADLLDVGLTLLSRFLGKRA